MQSTKGWNDVRVLSERKSLKGCMIQQTFGGSNAWVLWANQTGIEFNLRRLRWAFFQFETRTAMGNAVVILCFVAA